MSRARSVPGGRLTLTCALVTLAACQRTSPPPNILLYVVDTLRYDAVQCDGNDTVHTPAMDRIAQEGLRFARAYAAASWTRPSMASLLTGVYPRTHGALGRTDALAAGMPRLAGELRRLGYRTAAVYANPNIGPPFGFAEGFDEFIDLYPARYIHDRSAPPERVGTADNVVNRAIAWLRARPAKPFFLLVFSVDPHAPYEPPAPYNTLYDRDYSGPIDGSIKNVFGLLAAAKMGQLPAARDIRHLRALYDGEVAFNDAQLSRLLGELDRLQVANSTVFLLTSDHGEEFYEHGSGDHGHSLYEELIHIPLLMRWPGHIAPGRVYGDAVQLIDLYPTLLHIAAGHTSSTGPGRDLFDLLLGRDGARVASLAYAEEHLDDHNLRTMILDHRKLIYDAARPAPLSFDLQQDAGEQHPLTPVPAPDLMQAMEEVTRKSPAMAGATHPIRRDELPASVRDAMENLGYGDPTKGK